ATLFAAGKFPLLIGGDHSITIGALEALSRHWENPWVLQFDAHADLRDSYQGSPFSHACVMARARENFSCVQVGIRSWSEEEDARLWEHPERVFPASEIEENPRAAAARLEQVLGDPVYVTLDLDCLDPTCMPATGTPEPGGLGWRSLTRLLRLVAQRRHVVGCDICELSPIPGFVAPDFLAARLAAKMIAYVFQPRSESGG
ncbi:MAG: arginase family protein, partial [Candidatus Eisenbacteria bacterium]